MDPRRRKAVVLAGLVPCLSALGSSILSHHAHSAWRHAFIIGWFCVMLAFLALALKQIYTLKRNGNPY